MNNLFKNYKVYIIGHIPTNVSRECHNRFYLAQRTLEKGGFASVVNPLESYRDDIADAETKRLNFTKLMESNAVYILSNINIANTQNTELKIARDLNLVILHDSLFVDYRVSNF